MSKYIAIDLAPEGVFVVAGTARGGQVKVEQALSWTDADGEAPPLLTADTAKHIGEQLRDRLRAAGSPRRPHSFRSAAGGSSSRNCATPRCLPPRNRLSSSSRR